MYRMIHCKCIYVNTVIDSGEWLWHWPWFLSGSQTVGHLWPVTNVF